MAYWIEWNNGETSYCKNQDEFYVESGRRLKLGLGGYKKITEIPKI